MPNTGLGTSYPLTADEVSSRVSRTSAGAYALGHLDNEETFIVKYVGRSDSDVAGRLKKHVGEYRRFKFTYFDSARAAFEKECRMWHDFGGPDGGLANTIHPDAPNGSNATCPICGR